MNSRAYVSRFNFTGTDQQKKVGVLSGGERNRVHLAKLLRRGKRVAARRTDERPRRRYAASAGGGGADFVGCAVVSHDRWFLDRLATHILAFEGDSQVTWFEGSWQEYAAWVTETRGPEALEPHRIKYKPLVRA